MSQERGRVEKTCEHCGQQFSTKLSYQVQRFCNRTCQNAHERLHGRIASQVPAIEFSCKVCGNPFSYKPAYLKEYRKKYDKDPAYCSTKCGGIGRRLPDEAWKISCIQCGKLMNIQRRPGGTINRQKRLCSTECRSMFRRLDYQSKNPEQQPTKRVAHNGYVRMIVPGIEGKPSRDVFEHRYVMEKKLGRKLLPEETVHHKDGNREHNEETNLELFSSRHGPGQRVADKVTFAIEILRLYPEFAKAAGVTLLEHPTPP